MARLLISFEYDSASGLFFATLKNGARFAVDRHMIGGNLAKNLLLFRDVVLAEKKGEPFRSALPKKSAEQEAFDASRVVQLPYLGPKVKRPITQLTLDDLEIE
jgi:hypothetical protein